MSAPRHLSWRLQSTSVGRTIFGLFAAALVSFNAYNVLGRTSWWLGALVAACAVPVVVSWLTSAVTVWRYPEIRGVQLPLRPVSRFAVRVRTGLLICSVAAVAVGALVWALTGHWVPWVPVLGVGLLLTLVTYLDRSQLLDRAQNEALTNPVTPLV